MICVCADDKRNNVKYRTNEKRKENIIRETLKIQHLISTQKHFRSIFSFFYLSKDWLVVGAFDDLYFAVLAVDDDNVARLEALRCISHTGHRRLNSIFENKMRRSKRIVKKKKKEKFVTGK